jgi:hypothetical protein
MPNQPKDQIMATAINMSKKLSDFCEKYDLFEYGMSYIVTMPNGYTFITQDIDLSNRMLREHGASTRHIVELGE